MALLAAAAASPAAARTGKLQETRDEATALAADISALDARIDEAVQRYAQATQSLAAVREQLSENRRLRRLSQYELETARATLTARAVAMYKRGDVSTLDAIFAADDFDELVSQVAMVRRLARSDGEVVHTIEETKLEVADAAVKLSADERTAERLVQRRAAELRTIRAQLAERQGLLDGVRSEIRRLAAAEVKATPTEDGTVEPPIVDDGSGEWWPLIQDAGAANGVSARGLYRLMMIESGGCATIVGPGGYCGLFQYSPATWTGSWNPWRASSITDGAAQIKATALAIREGHGPSWWGASYAWAFGGV